MAVQTDPPASRFRAIGSRMPVREMEEDLRAFWRERAIFRRSVDERPAKRLYSFYEGPPTANGTPGVHHVLARVFKDLFPRYKTMRGYRVPRKGGWDTHGLPVELEVERELGLQTKRDIEAYGIAEFNQRCRASVMRYVQQWQDLTERIAFWIDMEDAYVTFSPEYVESCWWILKTLWDHDLIYEARRVTPHCPRCETSLASHELALGYREDTPDPSVYVKFRAHPETLPTALRDRARLTPRDTYLVAWTTTPWTLPGNTALAVNPSATYAVVERYANERLIVAEERFQAVFGDDPAEANTRIVKRVPGRDMVGVTYDGLYDPAAWGVQPLRFTDGRLESVPADETPLPRRVVRASFVSMDDGSGIVHIAPAFGEDDYTLGREEGLQFLQPVDLNGRFTGEASPFRGQFVKDADPAIMEDLRQRGLLLRHATIRHTYPFCWRCGTPLLYYAKPSWYIATTRVQDALVRSNHEQMHWYPAHLRDGRYGDWIAHNVDWAVSRERYWGTPLPFWRCEGCGQVEAFGSFADLRRRARAGDAIELEDPHRPYVDDIVLGCTACGGEMRRVPEVADAWFDSGAMPYAQWHYPFENRAVFAERFPADFICEAIDQTRGWFYSLHAEATLLHAVDAVPEPVAYRHVISLGHILDEAGEKMSKSRGNIVDPWAVLDEHGADALRWYLYTASPPGNPRRFSSALVGEAQRKFLLTLWNTYSFFVTYANIDGFDPASAPPAERSDLDRWIRSALHGTVQSVTASLEGYEPTDAARTIESFVDALSNWYLRRSRRRFWKSEDDADKAAAYHTLYECLLTLSHVLAPFTPYVADEIYRNLVRGGEARAAESVHLAAWPEANAALIDAETNAAMTLVQRIASLGRAARSKAGVKVRQPLPDLLVGLRQPDEAEIVRRHEAMLLDELNVKRVTVVDAAADLVSYVLKPNLPVLGPRLGKDVGRLRGALAALEPVRTAPIAQALAAGKTVQVEGMTLTAGDVLVEVRERPGAASAQDGGYTVAVTTAITPDLRQEGLARELVHRVQSMRRAAGFEIADRITLWLDGHAPEVIAAARAFEAYVRGETLATLVLYDAPAPDAAHADERIDGETLTVGVRRA